MRMRTLKHYIFIPAKIIETVMTLRLKDWIVVAIFTEDGDKYAIKCPGRKIADRLEFEIRREIKYCRIICIDGRITIKGKTGEEWNV